MALVVTKRCCNSLVIGECKLEQLKIPLYPIRQAKIRKADKAKCWQEDGETGSFAHTDKGPNLAELNQIKQGDPLLCVVQRTCPQQDQNRASARLFVPPIVCGSGKLKVIGVSITERTNHLQNSRRQLETKNQTYIQQQRESLNSP